MNENNTSRNKNGDSINRSEMNGKMSVSVDI